MIRIAFKFIGGFVLGAFLAFLLTYAFGFLMESMNVSLYDSERDQQRNFNIFIVVTIVVALVSGYFATKIGRKN